MNYIRKLDKMLVIMKRRKRLLCMENQNKKLRKMKIRIYINEERQKGSEREKIGREKSDKKGKRSNPTLGCFCLHPG